LVGDAREADERGRAVGYIGNPAMVAIAMREDGGNSKGGGGVTGRKAGIDAGVRYVTVEEGVVERAGRQDVRRAETPRGNFQDNVKDGTVGIGFPGEEGGLFRIGIVSEVPDYEEGCGDEGDFTGGDGTGEDIVERVKGGGAAEVPGVVGIRDEEGRGHSGDSEGWEPLMTIGELHGKQPDVFLILEEISGEGAVGDVALCSRWWRVLRSWVIHGDGLRRFLGTNRETRKGDSDAREHEGLAGTAEAAMRPGCNALDCPFPVHSFKDSSDLDRELIFECAS
jgi:hypothetical protein